MAGYTTAALAIAELVIAAVGTGISVYGQQQQASNSAAMANYNYQVQQQQQELNARVAQQQALWAEQSDRAQAQAQENNAIAIDQQRQEVEAQGREQAKRMRETNERQLSSQRARYGALGVTSEGSPLAVMAETAGLLELGVQDKAHETDLQSREYEQKAADERFQAGFSLMDASIQQYKSAATEAGYQLSLDEAQGGLARGLAGAQATRVSSYGTLLSGVDDTFEKTVKIARDHGIGGTTDSSGDTLSAPK